MEPGTTPYTPMMQALTWCVSLIAALIGVISGFAIWTFNKYDRRVTVLEETNKLFVPRTSIEQDYARKEYLADIEVRLAALVSRKELLAHLEKQYEERRAMHNENITVIRELRQFIEKRESDMSTFRHDIRDSLHDLALKVNSVSTIQKEDRGK